MIGRFNTLHGAHPNESRAPLTPYPVFPMLSPRLCCTSPRLFLHLQVCPQLLSLCRLVSLGPFGWVSVARTQSSHCYGARLRWDSGPSQTHGPRARASLGPTLPLGPRDIPEAPPGAHRGPARRRASSGATEAQRPVGVLPGPQPQAQACRFQAQRPRGPGYPLLRNPSLTSTQS